MIYKKLYTFNVCKFGDKYTTAKPSPQSIPYTYPSLPKAFSHSLYLIAVVVVIKTLKTFAILANFKVYQYCVVNYRHYAVW